MSSPALSVLEKDVLERGTLSKGRGQTMLIVIQKEKYEMMKDLILKEDGNLKFYITSEGDSFYYTYVVYHRSVAAQKNGGVTFLKPCSTYLENIKWIWKRGKLHEMHNFKGWQDKKYGDSDTQPNANLTMSELEKMNENEIKSTLNLTEYERWLHIRELENKFVN